MEKRSIKVDHKTAEEWFNGNNQTLKELALQAFSKEELTGIKEGDIVFATTKSGRQKFIFIYGKENYPSIDFGISEVQWHYNDKFFYNYSYKRKATEREIKLFKNILLENGYLYENGQLIKTRKRKRVAIGYIYYVIVSTGEIVPHKEANDSMDNGAFKVGNYFPTRAEAEIYAKKFLKMLKE